MSAAANRPVLTIRGVELGVGRPKVIVPLTDAHDSSLIASAKRIAASRTDMVEWRVDRYASRDDHTKVVAMAARIHEIHLLALHCLCDGVDAQLLGEQDADGALQPI